MSSRHNNCIFRKRYFNLVQCLCSRVLRYFGHLYSLRSTIYNGIYRKRLIGIMCGVPDGVCERCFRRVLHLCSRLLHSQLTSNCLRLRRIDLHVHRLCILWREIQYRTFTRIWRRKYCSATESEKSLLQGNLSECYLRCRKLWWRSCIGVDENVLLRGEELHSMPSWEVV